MTAASSASFGTDEHPEIAEISALTEGLLPPERSTDMRAHLSGCELCSDVRLSLEEIRNTLGTLPGPVRMPADVAGRIEAALAAEALLDATTPSADEFTTASGREAASTSPMSSLGARSTVSRETAKRRSDVSRETAAPGRPAGHARGTVGPGRVSRRSRHWRAALLGVAGAVASVSLGVLFVSGTGPEGSDSAGEQSVLADGSDRDLTDDGLEARVRSLLTENTAPSAEAQGAESGTAEFDTKASPNIPADEPGASMPSCVREGVNRDETPLAVGTDVYDGQQAYIVVLPQEADRTRVDAYVVDAGCVGKTPPEAGKVLITRTVTRP